MNPRKSPAERRVRLARSKPAGNHQRVKRGKPPPRDANDEVSALIATLHETGQRLEELTAGEVDTVADRDGRTFVLRRAQHQLRVSEAARQAAILNALPSPIALLDTQGHIISVNAAWRRFAGTNVLQGPRYGTGVNYLEICDRVRGDDAPAAHQVAEGIRSVLHDSGKTFSIEYPCHSPTEQRWFLMTVTPLADDHPNGAVVMHLDITERRRGDEKLLRFGAAMDAIADAILLVDRSSMRFVHVNDSACRFMNMTREELLALEPWVSISISRTELEHAYDTLIVSGVDPEPVEIQRRRPGRLAGMGRNAALRTAPERAAGRLSLWYETSTNATWPRRNCAIASRASAA